MINNDEMNPLAAAYLKRLRRAARALPRARRRDLLEEIEMHLRETLPPGSSESEAEAVIARLGTPDEIVAADLPAGGAAGAGGAWREVAAVMLLLFGGFILGIGWLVGVVLLWSSRVWTLRDKLIGTLILPEGLAASLLLAVATGTASRSTSLCRVTARGASHCSVTTTPGSSDLLGSILAAIAVLAPLATAVYLSVRASRARRRLRGGPPVSA